MTIEEYRLQYCPKLDPAIVRAAQYLEAHGRTFLIHFGTGNAIEQATDLYLVILAGMEDESEGRP